MTTPTAQQRLEKKVDGLDEKIDTLIERVGSVNTDLLLLSSRLDANDRDKGMQLDALRLSVKAETDARIAAIVNERASVEKDMAGLRTRMEAINARIDRAVTWGMGVLGTLVSAGLVYLLFTTR